MKLKIFNHKHFKDADGSFTIRFPMEILQNIQDFIKIMTKIQINSFFAVKKIQLFEDKIV